MSAGDKSTQWFCSGGYNRTQLKAHMSSHFQLELQQVCVEKLYCEELTRLPGILIGYLWRPRKAGQISSLL